MNQGSNNRENSHARRRPSSVSRVGNDNTQRNVNRGDGSYSFRAGNARQIRRDDSPRQKSIASSRHRTPAAEQSSNVRESNRYPARRVTTALSPADQRKLQRQERRLQLQERREEKWQSNVVRVKGGPDYFMLAIVLILLALGTVMVFSASYPLAIKENRPSNYYINKQLQFLFFGGLLMTCVMILPTKFFKEWKLLGIKINTPKIAFAVSCVLLVYALVAGLAEGVTMRWVSLGFFNLQPSELMKISIVLLLAWYAEKYESQIMTPLATTGKRSGKYNVFYPLLICGIGCGLILAGRHLSGTVITAMIAFFLLIIGGIKISSFLAVAIPLAGGIIALFLVMFPYALERITTMLDSNADKLDEAWQTTQSVYAIGSGGLFGVGLGQSRQKYSYLSNAHTDFIFSIWCEELGFIGAILLIALFVLFVWRGYTIAVRAPDKFTMMTAFGITTHVGLQAFLNMAVASDLIPNTGITLPFFSYGGSSLIVLMIEMGILLSISRRSYKKKSDMERRVYEADYI